MIIIIMMIIKITDKNDDELDITQYEDKTIHTRQIFTVIIRIKISKRILGESIAKRRREMFAISMLLQRYLR